MRFQTGLHEAGSLLKEAGCVFCEYRMAFLLFILAVLAAAVFTIQHDVPWYLYLKDHRTHETWRIANQFSKWGDYTRATLILTAVIGGLGLLRKKPAWTRAALACFVAASLAGATVTTIRMATGRPRPNANRPDGFYGPKWDRKSQSFPSAHSGTSFATATALAISLPPVGLPCLAGAAGVAWSRLYTRVHYTTDVLVGIGIGTVFGVVFGVAARRRSRQSVEVQDGR